MLPNRDLSTFMYTSCNLGLELLGYKNCYTFLGDVVALNWNMHHYVKVHGSLGRIDHVNFERPQARIVILYKQDMCTN